jgi:hypothetical protein
MRSEVRGTNVRWVERKGREIRRGKENESDADVVPPDRSRSKHRVRGIAHAFSTENPARSSLKIVDYSSTYKLCY